MTKKRYAVLIADVVGSSSRRNLRSLLMNRLELARRAHRRARWIRLPYAVTAGDEFQAILAPAANIPELIFDLQFIICGDIVMFIDEFFLIYLVLVAPGGPAECRSG